MAPWEIDAASCVAALALGERIGRFLQRRAQKRRVLRLLIASAPGGPRPLRDDIEAAAGWLNWLRTNDPGGPR